VTTLRKALEAASTLQELVEDGLQAVEKAHRGLIDAGIRAEFDDSIDIDTAFEEGHENEYRWDYLLGHRKSKRIVGLEPHSAANHEISRVIGKRSGALVHIRNHLQKGVAVTRWFWVASGNVDFLPVDKAVLRLAEGGITFVGRKLLKKHLA